MSFAVGLKYDYCFLQEPTFFTLRMIGLICKFHSYESGTYAIKFVAMLVQPSKCSYKVTRPNTSDALRRGSQVSRQW